MNWRYIKYECASQPACPGLVIDVSLWECALILAATMEDVTDLRCDKTEALKALRHACASPLTNGQNLIYWPYLTWRTFV